MGIFDDMFGGFSWGTTDDTMSHTEINPASGLPMIDGFGGVDVGGNPYGFDSSDSFSGGCGSSFGGGWSSFDDDF